jgi:predicted membrane protein
MINNLLEFFRRCFGERDFIHTSNTTPVTGVTVGPVVACADTVIASLVTSQGVTHTTINLPAGMGVYGNFTAYTLTSGEVLAYKR